jgi:hypothetical protein
MLSSLHPSDFQPELALRAAAVERDETELGIAELLGLLRGRGWQTKQQILARRPAWTERTIRTLASASGGRIVSAPGSRGYCHHEEASTKELEHAGSQMISQGRAMARRGIVFRRMAQFRRLAAPQS